ncbi:ParA family protein [Enterobacter sp. BNK-29]|uniref:ParA family protein n=1 Tax=Enterobacter sp. BNK-29 TaxID=3376164 RepID=UPI003B50682D
MITFDQIVPSSTQIISKYTDLVQSLDWLVLNRDLNGRVRLVAPESIKDSPQKIEGLHALENELSKELHGHYHNVSTLFENDIEYVKDGAQLFRINGFENVFLADRYANESSWGNVSKITKNSPRVVFFSIKGGVGRSTSLAAASWKLAQQGKTVLVLDLDLESPGLSTALLPIDRQPKYGITDWLVEDLVDNGEQLIDSMIATSPLSHDGEIFVVPAHGVEAGEYVSKLGRVWMPKVDQQGRKEKWSQRLNRLIDKLEQVISPDIILIDSRSGIDEIASCCVTDMGANLVLLFALDGLQTWNGYKILFEHWLNSEVANDIRERLQIVASMVPETDKIEYLISLRDHAYDLFSNNLYDEIEAAPIDAVGPSNDEDYKWKVRELVEGWNFDSSDEGAPHNPWAIQWHRSFTGSLALHGRLATIDENSIKSIFGPLIEGIESVFDSEISDD